MVCRGTPPNSERNHRIWGHILHDPTIRRFLGVHSVLFKRKGTPAGFALAGHDPKRDLRWTKTGEFEPLHPGAEM